MSYHIVKMAIIDMEIDRLTSIQKHIDNRLDELYTEREDVYVEYMNLETPVEAESWLDD